MSKILVAVSSKIAAERLVDPVADLASRMDSEVIVVHVSRPSAGAARNDESNDASDAVKALQDGVVRKNVAVNTLLLFSDDIAQAILNVAVEQKVSMICLGLTGKNVFARLLAGNVPLELLRGAKIPVLLFPADWNRPIGAEPPAPVPE